MPSVMTSRMRISWRSSASSSAMASLLRPGEELASADGHLGDEALEVGRERERIAGRGVAHLHLACSTFTPSLSSPFSPPSFSSSDRIGIAFPVAPVRFHWPMVVPRG